MNPAEINYIRHRDAQEMRTAPPASQMGPEMDWEAATLHCGNLAPTNPPEPEAVIASGQSSSNHKEVDATGSI